MKRLLLLASLILPTILWSDINVTQGSGKTVATDSINSREYQNVKIIDGTTGGTSSATVTAIGLKVDLTTTSVSGTLSDNGAASGSNRVPILPSIYQRDLGGGAASTSGRDASLQSGIDGALRIAPLPALGSPNSYTASTSAFAIAGSTLDFVGFCGNASSMVVILDARVSCTETTAGVIPISLVYRTSAYAGTWSTVTAHKDDSNFSVPHSSLTIMTALPSIDGTLTDYLDNEQIGCMATGTATPNDVYLLPSTFRQKGIVLRGTSQCIGFNTQSSSVTGGKFTVTLRWIETTTFSP